jgi:hypothetical protein
MLDRLVVPIYIALYHDKESILITNNKNFNNNNNIFCAIFEQAPVIP